jgi:FkbM family methyltransferase
MRGILRNAHRFYREHGLVPTLLESVDHTLMHLRRSLLLAKWRLTERAAIDIRDETIRFHASTPAERHALWWLQHHESDPVTRLIATLDEDDVFYDIGANIGFYTCATAVLTDATVHAFEPHPGNARRLEENLAKNAATAEVHELALGATTGETEFVTASPEEPGPGHGVFKRAREPDDGSTAITVQQRTISAVVETGIAPRPDVVKIDVEGSEGRVLDGMADLVESGAVRAIFLEIHNPADHRLSVEDFGSSEAEILSRLEEWGFTIDSRNPGAAEHHLVATR